MNKPKVVFGRRYLSLDSKCSCGGSVKLYVREAKGVCSKCSSQICSDISESDFYKNLCINIPHVVLMDFLSENDCVEVVGTKLDIPYIHASMAKLMNFIPITVKGPKTVKETYKGDCNKVVAGEQYIISKEKTYLNFIKFKDDDLIVFLLENFEKISNEDKNKILNQARYILDG